MKMKNIHHCPSPRGAIICYIIPKVDVARAPSEVVMVAMEVSVLVHAGVDGLRGLEATVQEARG